MNAQSIRVFFRELFGSREAEVLREQMCLRLAEKDILVARLEEDLLRLRSDFEARIQDRDETVSSLRANIVALEGKVFLYETTLMPLASRAGAEVVAAIKPRRPSFASDFNAPPIKSRWQQVQEEHEAQMRKELEEEKQEITLAAALGENNG